MKKIGIVTVYHTENAGSVLQATALKYVLSKMGFDVYYINTYNRYSAHSNKYLLKRILKSMKNHTTVRSCISCYRYYDSYIKRTFNVVDPDKVYSTGIDKLIVGSDTVWDVNSKYFKESESLFWGTYWRNIPITSFAASVANSDALELKRNIKYGNALKQFDPVGVRDAKTKDIVEQILGKEVTLNCDPTMLLGVEEYKNLCFNVDDKYVLVYLFEEINDKLREQINKFAKDNDLKVYCVGKYIKGCDSWIAPTVENFLSFFLSAEYVITNTFHGTVFSILFNKQFVSLDYRKDKVKELLNSFGLSSRLTKSDVQILKSELIDYDEVNLILDSFRKESYSYLLGALNEKLPIEN